MIGKDLVAYVRESILDDIALPQLWKDTEILRNLNFAEVQACRRAHLIIDATTPSDSGTAGTASTMGQQSLCVLPIIANQATYYLSPKILQVKRCQLLSMPFPLNGPVSYPELDDRIPEWWGTSGTVGTAGSGGNPTHFMNEPNNTITFVRAPSTNDTALLVISRLPLLSFTLQSSPEIEEKHHQGLANWAAHLCFLKPDSDTLNMNLASLYEAKFTNEFGPLPTAYEERIKKVLSQQQRMRPRPFGS